MIDLPQTLRDSLIQVFSRRPEVKRVILFGSRVRGDAEDRSDIDLAIEAPDADPRQWLDVWFHLKEDLDTLLTVDVIRLEEAPADLANRIRSEGEVLYEQRKDGTKPAESGGGPSAAS